MTTSRSLDDSIRALFDAERSVRRLHDELAAADREPLLGALREPREEEASLRLVRIAALLAEAGGDRAIDLLIDVLASESPEARVAAGESLTDLAFDRFKEVALGVERALSRLPKESLALPELPFILIEVPEPGVARLLEKFLSHPGTEVVAAGIEAASEFGDESLVRALSALRNDKRIVELEDESGERDAITIGELAAEACEILESGDEA
jgi:HEAT repeat protein